MKTSNTFRQNKSSSAQPFQDFSATPSATDQSNDESNGTAKPGFRRTNGASSKNASRQLQTNGSSNGTKLTKFFVEAPLAHSVKLVADFTNWEKSPLKMKRDENGQWQANVPLSPGRYEYRFIVNEEWCDDPCCDQKVPNPFGSMNAIVEVR